MCSTTTTGLWFEASSGKVVTSQWKRTFLVTKMSKMFARWLGFSGKWCECQVSWSSDSHWAWQSLSATFWLGDAQFHSTCDKLKSSAAVVRILSLRGKIAIIFVRSTLGVGLLALICSSRIFLWYFYYWCETTHQIQFATYCQDQRKT